MQVLKRYGYATRRLLRARGIHVSRLSPDSALDILLLMLIKQFRCNCVLDIGANTGGYGQYLRRAGYTGWIVSFEPRRAAYSLLSEQAHTDRRWSTHRLAIGDEEGQKLLNLANPVGDGGSSSFLRPTPFGIEAPVMGGALRPESMGEESVPITRLDTIFPDIVSHIRQPRILLKTDVQGYDIEVLKGATSSLNQVKIIQSEVSFLPIYEAAPLYAEYIQFAKSLGFEPSGIFPTFRDEHARIVEADLVLVRTP